MKSIKFASEGIRAVLENRKSMTRRIIKPQPIVEGNKIKYPGDSGWHVLKDPNNPKILKEFTETAPYQVGDKVQVYEVKQCKYKGQGPAPVDFKVDGLFVEITEVRVEKLLDITPDDCVREGIEQPEANTTGAMQVLTKFAELWNSCYGPGAWEKNPYVFVYGFSVINGGGMNNKKKLQKELKELWSQRVFETWGTTCICCPKKATQPHHYIPKSKSLALRYDVQNGIPLCTKDHYLIHFSNNPEETRRLCEIIRKFHGEAWCFYIEDNKGNTAKNAIWWLEAQKELLCQK